MLDSAINVGKAAFDSLFPKTCLACEEYLPRKTDEPICETCNAALLEVPKPRCRRCYEPRRTPVGSDSLERDYLCGRCVTDPPPFETARAPWAYAGTMRDILLSIKSGTSWKCYQLGQLFSNWLVGYLNDHEFNPKSDLLTAVPTHNQRLRQRGFDHLRQILTAATTDICVEPSFNVLQKIKQTPRQGTLSRSDRIKNPKDAFKCLQDVDTYRRAFVFDDILTTGATASSVSNELISKGIDEVFVVTLARAGDL